MSSWTNVVQAIGTAVAAFGVFVLIWQRQAMTTFEDDLAGQYREIAHKIPIEALLGEELEDKVTREVLVWFYQYVDLSNEQVFLRQKNRVRPATWKEWCAGIKSNLALPAFARAWAEIKTRAPHSFQELRRLEETGFEDDPHSWG